MTTQVFNDLSRLLHVQYTDRILVIFDDPVAFKIGFRQHPDDEKQSRVPFVTYIGGESKDELKAIVSCYKLSGYTIRKGQRVKHPFELKIRGMAFSQLQQLIKELD